MNEMTTKGRRRFSAEDRARWMELYQHSSRSVRDFCRANALCQSSLSRWLRQSRAVTRGLHPQGSLVEVRVAPAPASAASVKVCLPGGVTMEVASGTDAAWLAGVLCALRLTEG